MISDMIDLELKNYKIDKLVNLRNNLLSFIIIYLVCFF